MAENQIGDVVEYLSGGCRRRVEIEELGEKDGRATFVGVLVEDEVAEAHWTSANMEEGDGAWGYISQIEQ